jgi:hypothetical protein
MKRISENIYNINLTGCLLGMWPNGQPVLFVLFEEEGYFFPIFTTKEKYDAAAKFANFVSAKSKKIENHSEFLSSFEDHEEFRSGKIKLSLILILLLMVILILYFYFLGDL